MPVRTVCGVAALAAAVVAVCVLRGRHRRLRRAVAAERLLSGRVRDDNAVLARDLEAFRRRLGQAVAGPAEAVPSAVVVPVPVVPAGPPSVPCSAARICRIAPLEGGPR